jgi:hypothetical protein
MRPSVRMSSPEPLRRTRQARSSDTRERRESGGAGSRGGFRVVGDARAFAH